MYKFYVHYGSACYGCPPPPLNLGGEGIFDFCQILLNVAVTGKVMETAVPLCCLCSLQTDEAFCHKTEFGK